MLDIKLIRDKRDEVEKALLKRVAKDVLNLGGIIALDDNRKEILIGLEALKAERNKNSKVKPTPEIIEQMKKIGEEVKELEANLRNVEDQLKEKLSELPNIPAEDVLPGGKENNKVVKTFGEKPEFSFEPIDHVELAKRMDLIDYDRGVKIAGSGFWCYRGNGALLEWALLNYFKDFHVANGYTFILPPFLLNEDSAYASGHLPKFRDDLFWTSRSSENKQGDSLCLNATSEMMINNLHRNEVLDEIDLPLKYFAYSPCFRKEPGGYGAGEKGTTRGHQFNKIEMFQFTRPEDSWSGFEELVGNAEKLVEGLGLHYQTVQLAAQDASASMSKTCDIEVWIPSMNTYKEVSSASNAIDYQARRADIKYKSSKTGKNEFVHTLNASGLATSRLLPAILEQFQQEDGSVRIPEVLHKYMNGVKEIKSK
ncbi:MAG: Serine-tRNA ligase 2 [Candidatus Yanofskybacteria bacterium GW2011_GWF1_44_227]|uniref:Serine--tRNA ligase n=1 Tax=Candidatus Yanofskybacteria bacterium GW2011_GWE2_40_11 TaxID=1619033 RepID=A0A0G0QL00_9BACT|nr:MAG: Serine-tRNA ligase 2 [Candidatus Yanofskybacteria bacterium GW2011_GWE1_40_10]KKR40793.1 MAG: Serine-tRNA ligase 2 [Candidatus Yanofskybacteria bacterium GW2011_GWE2_40_11]KKT15908.1 MAG: Serine-tRNA ligase 2 [Candidatus Yanofskybacteria bacterium GW2011_GWF2_43_596]KKT53578.1 MAG: Serine-tRNA ligase 2 [Candidatus Yanofskybacteria bacterium GW2011_GWF1_44_227]OGN36103.1 MAG: serine--tRNA ligase [Candidatus Yanofskybacteria bacterium RIFOXYA1_FULL_44_17]OGN36295.1 MAG: serine--tRNA liga